MEGIVVSEAMSEHVPLVVPIMFIGIGLILSVLIVLAIRLAVINKDAGWLVSTLLPMIVLVAVVGLAIYSFKLYFEPAETTYKVIVSDDISVNKFLEKYEIVSIEGKIYEVRER